MIPPIDVVLSQFTDNFSLALAVVPLECPDGDFGFNPAHGAGDRDGSIGRGGVRLCLRDIVHGRALCAVSGGSRVDPICD
jgi:hypothetical protein